MLKEIEDSQGNIILFIDELHTLVGAGAAEGSIDASNMLKPALARGELRAIGATTLNEYRKYIEKDACLLYTSLTFAYFIAPQHHLPGAPWYLASLLILISLGIAWVVAKDRKKDENKSQDNDGALAPAEAG